MCLEFPKLLLLNDYSKFGKVTIVSNNTVFGIFIKKGEVTVKSSFTKFGKKKT